MHKRTSKLNMDNVVYFQEKHTGTYVCQAVGYPKTYIGATRSVYLKVVSKFFTTFLTLLCIVVNSIRFISKTGLR